MGHEGESPPSILEALRNMLHEGGVLVRLLGHDLVMHLAAPI